MRERRNEPFYYGPWWRASPFPMSVRHFPLPDTHTHAHTRTHTRARAHTHTHTRTHARTHILHRFFSYILKIKVNSSQSMSWCSLKMLLSRIMFSNAILENCIYLTLIVSTSRAIIIWTLHPNIRRSVISVIVMHTNEESSVASFSMQTLTVSGSTLIKLSLYLFRSIL